MGSSTPAVTPIPQVNITERDTPLVTVYAQGHTPPDNVSPLCSGEDDQNLINQVLTEAHARGGGSVRLTNGCFVCSADVSIPENVRLVGAGPTRTELVFADYGAVSLSESGGGLENVSISGSGMVLVTASDITVRNVSATSDTKPWTTFAIEAPGSGTIEGISLIDCAAINSGTTGFMLSSTDGSGTIKNAQLVRCRALNCGRESRFNEWVVGFDLTERADIENITVAQCYAEGSWESGFHAEGKPGKEYVRLIDCTSVQNGQRRQYGQVPDYGAGFMVTAGMQLVRCRSLSNEVGYLCTVGDAMLHDCEDTGSRTGMLIQDIVSPAGFLVSGGHISGANSPIVLQSTGEWFGPTMIRGVTITRTGYASGPAVVVRGVPNPEQISLVDTFIQGYSIGIVEAEAKPIVRRNVTVGVR